jgi:hypothetical protein
MVPTSRRALLAGLAALAIAAPAHAADKLVDLKKVFPYLDIFLKMPPAERSRFGPSYTFTQEGRPISLPMWIVDGGVRTPLPLVDGRAERLPTAAQLEHGKLAIAADEKVKFGVRMDIVPLVAPAAEMDARELNAAVAQAAAGVKKAAGPLGFMAPKITKVLFHGASSGEVRFADGRRAALPLEKGTPVYNPANFPGAVALRFARPPASLELS